MQREPKNINFVFFGTSEFSVGVLEALHAHDLIPTLIVATPDEPRGRGLELQPVPTKIWAAAHNVLVEQPKSLKDQEIRSKLQNVHADVFIVASYGKIIPKDIFELPPRKTLNIHPSLLPKLRGAAPLQYTILNEDSAGVTIMRINEKMDEGPIIAQEHIVLPEWPPRYRILESLAAKRGGELLTKILPDWLEGKIPEQEQDNSRATYTHKIAKLDADITNDSPEIALRKIRAYEIWPRARINDLIITDAHIENAELIIDKVIPPGKKEMDYADYMRGKR